MTTNLPAANLLDEGTMVDRVAHWIDLVAAALKSETNRLRLQYEIRARLQAGDEQVTIQVIGAARAGHQDADQALRDHIREKIHNNEVSLLPPLLVAYMQEALYRPPYIRPAGTSPTLGCAISRSPCWWIWRCYIGRRYR